MKLSHRAQLCVGFSKQTRMKIARALHSKKLLRINVVMGPSIQNLIGQTKILFIMITTYLLLKIKVFT